MTDNRIEKIRAEIERLKHQSVIDSDRQAERGLQSASMASFGKVKACEELLSFIDSMQKELKACMYSKDNYTAEDRTVLCDGCKEECKFNKKEEPVSEIDFEQELYKYFGQVKDFTLGMRIAKRFYEIGRNYQEFASGEQVKKSLISKHEDKTCKENGNSLTQEHVNNGFDDEVKRLWEEINTGHSYSIVDSYNLFYGLCMDIAEWQKEHLWKSADGEDLSEIGREVVAFQEIFPTDVDVPSLFKIVVAHRPPEYWDGKDIVTGKVTRHYPKTYGKGGWNIPDVKYWLDCSMPKEIEL